MPKIDVTNNLSYDVQSAILIIISTLLIVFFAKKFFWKPIFNYLEARKQFIQSQIDVANQDKEAAASLKEDYQNQLQNIKEKSHQLLEEATLQAKQEREVLIDKAKKESEQIVIKTKHDMEQEKLKQESELSEKVKVIAFATASKILEKEIDETQHEKYVEDFINTLE